MANKPNIRFKGFTDDWEQRKLAEIATMHARIGWQNLRTSEFLDKGDYMLITGTDFDDGRINYSTCHYVEKERYDQDTHIQIHNGNILITKDGTLGKVAYVQELDMPATLNAGVFNVEIKNENHVDGKFLFQYLKAPFLMEYVGKKATGGTIKHLNQNILVNFPIVLPKKAEQDKIGRCFENIDHLITLHQRKCDETKKLKKFMLQKMFPKNGEKNPEIRFAGFTDDWEQRKFDELFTGLQNNTLSRSELNYENGTLMDVHYGDILVKFGEYIDVSKHQLPYINDATIANKYDGSFLKDGDIIIADTAEDSTVGKCTEILGANNYLLISGLHTIPCRPMIKFASKYLGYYMNSSAYRKQLIPLMQGIKVTSISKSSIYDTKLIFPKSISEQAKIGEYFSTLDRLITLHQRKCDKLKLIKKFMLQNMFPKKG